MHFLRTMQIIKENEGLKLKKRKRKTKRKNSLFQGLTIHDKEQELKNAEDAQPHCLACDCLKNFHGHYIIKTREN